MRACRNRQRLWGVLAGAVFAGACTGTPDLVREEKAPGEAYSPAEQFRILGSGKAIPSDYFINRGKVENGIELFGPDREQDKKSTALQERVTRLEQQIQVKPTEDTQPPPPVSQAAAASAPNPSSVAPPIPNDKKPNPGPVSSKSGTSGMAAETVDSVRIKTRLQLLKDLRDQHLITDEQYQTKVKDMLSNL